MRLVKASIAALAVAATSLWGGARADARERKRHHHQHGGARLAADPLHAGRIRQAPTRRRSGNNVKLVIDFIPWGSFYQRVAASLSSGEKKYQMIVTDSQWLGDFVEGGHYLKLNKYIDADPELQAVIADMHPVLEVDLVVLSLQVAELLRLPAIPRQSGDGLSVRTCSATRPSGRISRSSINQALPCYYNEWEDVDWDRFENIGKFFQRKKGDKLGDGVADDDFYGIAYQAGKPYDFSSMQVNGFIWASWRRHLGRDRQPSPRSASSIPHVAVKAFEHYLSLLKYMPPVAKTGQMDIFVVQDLYMQGKVAAIVDWVGVMGPVINPKLSKVADKSDFAEPPGTRKPDGSISRWSNIGGQPFVLTTWNSDEVVKEALDIVKWWMSKPVQINFVKARRSVRHAERDERSGLRDLGAVQPRLSRQLSLAEGRLAYSGVLPVADAAAGAIRQGHHRPDQRQAGLGYGRRIPGQDAA